MKLITCSQSVSMLLNQWEKTFNWIFMYSLHEVNAGVCPSVCMWICTKSCWENLILWVLRISWEWRIWLSYYGLWYHVVLWWDTTVSEVHFTVKVEAACGPLKHWHSTTKLDSIITEKNSSWNLILSYQSTKSLLYKAKLTLYQFSQKRLGLIYISNFY